MLSVTGPGPLWTSRNAAQAQPALQAEPGAVREVRPRRRDALRRPRRPLPDLERAERRGLARAAADVRGAARLHPRLAAPLPRPRARRAAGDRARRPGRAGAARRARAARSPRDLHAQPGLAAAVPARAGVRGPALQADAQRPVPRLQARAARTPSATTRTASSSAPRTPTRTATRPRSATCRGSSPCSTGSRARGRIGAPDRRFDVYLTEFGYQTSPPDHGVGISLGRQTRYLQQASYLAWRLPRVRNLTQYQWRDEPVVARGRGPREYAGWQSGLRYVNDRPKPAFRGFTEPFVIDLAPRRRRGALLGPDPARQRRPHRHAAAPARRPAQVPRARRGRAPTRAASGRARCRSSGARSTASPGSRPPSPPAAQPTRAAVGHRRPRERPGAAVARARAP